MHYAVSSFCAENIEALANYMKEQQEFFHKIIMTSEISNCNNYLHNVVEQITDANLHEYVKILEILLTYGCNPNHLNSDLMSPFEALLERMENIPKIKQFVDKFRDFNLEVHESYREAVEKLNMTNVTFRNACSIDDNYLLQLVKQGNEDLFLSAFENFNLDEISQIDIFPKILKSIIDMNFSKAILKIQSSDILKNILYEKDSLSYALSLCRCDIVQQLLNSKSLKLKFVLHELCAMTEIDNEEDHRKCFNLIIQDFRCTKEVINSFDNNFKTPLMYACENNHVEIQKDLIERGAYIGFDPIINNLHERILQQQLDKAISSSSATTDHNCMVQVNYNSLIPTTDLHHMEIEAIHLIATQKRFKEILVHPVITSFVELKWKRVNLLMYGTLLIYFLFFAYMSIFFLSSFNNVKIKPVVTNRMSEDTPGPMQPGIRNLDVLSVIVGRRKREAVTPQFCHNSSFIENHKTSYRISVFGTVLLTTVEIVQMVFTWRRYFLKLSNWIDCIFLALAYVVILQSFGDCTILKQMRAVLFIVIAVQSFIILGRISKLSLHLEIFKKVMKTFLKFMTLYFMLIFAFAMAFYTIFGNNNRVSQNPNGKEQDEKENGFDNILISTVTVIRMMLSDFDAIDLKPDDRFTAMVFLCFVLLITIILFNLINALAITDTQQIMKSAEIVDVRKRIRMIWTCEKILKFMKIDYFNLMDTNVIPDGKIFLNVNKDCFIRIKKNNENNDHALDTSYTQVSMFIQNNMMLVELGGNHSIRRVSSKVIQFAKSQNIKLSQSTLAKVVDHLTKFNERDEVM